MLKSALALLLLLPLPLHGSDHIDGPVTMQHRLADLTDLYAFPTPGKPGHLTVILNAYPVVHASGHFDEKVSYKLTFRSVALQGTGDRGSFETDAANEASLHCTFETPKRHEEHVATCESGNGLRVSSGFNALNPSAEGAALRLFAGMRADPFFFNADWATTLSTKGKIKPPSDSNTMDSINVLSLVLEIDMRKLVPGAKGTLFGLAAESFAREKGESTGRRMDRLGRPEITNVSLVAHKDAQELRDLYNLDQPFKVSSENQKRYRERLMANIDFFDAADGKKEWSERERDQLASVLVDDFLLVDIGKACKGESFL